MSLSPKTRQALKAARDGAVQAFDELIKSIETATKNFKVPGLDTSPSGLIEAEKSIEALKQLKTQMISGTINFASSYTLKQYTMHFGFVTNPELKTAANSMGGYFDILVNGIQTQERAKQEYRVLMLQSSLSIAANLSFQLLAGKLNESFLNKLGLGNAMRGLVRRMLPQMAARILAGAALAKFTLGLSLVAGIIFAGVELLKMFFASKQLERATQMANDSALIAMFNPASLNSLFLSNAFLLGTEIQKTEDITGRTRLLMGTEFEDRLFGEETTENYSLTSRVYESAYMGRNSNFSSGFDIRGFGFGSAKILSVASNMERRLPQGYDEDSIANILFMSGVFSGGETGVIERIIENISRSTVFDEADVNLATEKFEEFFAAVVGNGSPQAAHFSLIKALSEFSLKYSLSTKGNLESTTEIAQIYQFMSDGDSGINSRFDEAPVTTLIKSVDDLLFKGATFTNLGAVSLLDSLGISREEAIKGVTSDAGIFERYISGLFTYLNVSNEDVLTGSLNFDLALQNFSLKFGIGATELNPLVIAMRKYASGETIEGVRSEYITNIQDSIDDKLSSATSGVRGASNFFEILNNITYSSNKLLGVTEKNIAVVSSIQNMTQDLVLQGFGTFATAFVNIFNVVLGVNAAIKTPRRSVDESFSPLGITREELFDVGAGDFRNDEVVGQAKLDLGLARHAQRTMVPAHLQEEEEKAPVTTTGLGLGDTSVEASFLTLGIRTFDDLITVLYDVNPNIADRVNEIYDANYQDLGYLINEDFINQFRELWLHSEYGPESGLRYQRNISVGSVVENLVASVFGVALAAPLLVDYEDYVQEDLVLPPELLIPELVESQIDGLEEFSENFKFEKALAFTKLAEGGLSMHYNDRGNWTSGIVGEGELKGTNFGISAMAYPNLDIENLTQEDAKAIYKRDFWDKIDGDNIPYPLSTAVFDFAVNSGIGRARSFLQNLKHEHGDKSLEEQILIFQDKRKEFVRGLSSYSDFGRGWENRLTNLDNELATALKGAAPGYALGGFVIGENLTSGENSPKKSAKNILITIPLRSKSPHASAQAFSSYISSYLNA